MWPWSQLTLSMCSRHALPSATQTSLAHVATDPAAARAARRHTSTSAHNAPSSNTNRSPRGVKWYSVPGASRTNWWMNARRSSGIATCFPSNLVVQVDVDRRRRDPVVGYPSELELDTCGPAVDRSAAARQHPPPRRRRERAPLDPRRRLTHLRLRRRSTPNPFGRPPASTFAGQRRVYLRVMSVFEAFAPRGPVAGEHVREASWSFENAEEQRHQTHRPRPHEEDG